MATWLNDLVNYVDDRKNNNVLCPTVQSLRDLIESKAEIQKLASGMWEEAPIIYTEDKDFLSKKLVRDYNHMLQLLNVVVQEVAPSWCSIGLTSGLVGAPFATILQWAMGTESGFAFFRRTDVNEKFKLLMNTWRDDVLMTAKSQYVLTSGKNGWLSKDAMAVLERESNQIGEELRFDELFKCDPISDPVHWKFKTWDEFFVREFRDIDKLRPVAYADNPEWIVNPCEYRPYAVKTNVKEKDQFWIKGHNYSVSDMMDNHDFVPQFVGGTVYQAFLSPFSYHRWASPVSGKVVAAKVVDGDYFSEPPSKVYEGPKNYDLWPSDRAQAYLSHVATRAVLFIEAPQPVGLMCVVFIGMADVSSCDIVEKFSRNLPQPVKKGDEIGMFHHGGSSCALIFRKGVKLDFVPEAMPTASPTNRPVRGALARVRVDQGCQIS
jgi:phosphatidylserine decarboxylase